MQLLIKRTTLVQVWLLILNINCLPGVLKSNNEIAKRLQCQISNDVEELLQIDQIGDGQYGILRTQKGHIITIPDLQNSFLGQKVIVLVNKQRVKEFQIHLRYEQNEEFQQYILEGINYIYTQTKLTSKSNQVGIKIHLLSIYEEGQVYQAIQETQNGLQYVFKFNERQDYFIQLIFATTESNQFVGNQEEIEYLMKRINLEYQQCIPVKCDQDQEFLEKISSVNLNQLHPKYVKAALYETTQSIYHYDFINNMYISTLSISSKQIQLNIQFTEECIKLLRKVDEKLNIIMEYDQYFCVTNLIHSFRFSSTQLSEKQINYLIILQSKADIEPELLIQEIFLLITSLECVKDRYSLREKLRSISSVVLLQQQQPLAQEKIENNQQQYITGTEKIESISFDDFKSDPEFKPSEQIIQNIDDDIFAQPNEIADKQHEQRMQEVEKQIIKTQEIAETIKFDQDEVPDIIVQQSPTIEDVVLDEYNQPQTTTQVTTIVDPQQLPQQQFQQQQNQDESIAINKLSEDKQIDLPFQKAESPTNSHPRIDHQYHQHQHQHHHHHHNYGNNEPNKHPTQNDNNTNYKKTNLRGNDHYDKDPLIADRIVIEYNFINEQQNPEQESKQQHTKGQDHRKENAISGPKKKGNIDYSDSKEKDQGKTDENNNEKELEDDEVKENTKQKNKANKKEDKQEETRQDDGEAEIAGEEIQAEQSEKADQIEEENNANQGDDDAKESITEEEPKSTSKPKKNCSKQKQSEKTLLKDKEEAEKETQAGEEQIVEVDAEVEAEPEAEVEGADQEAGEGELFRKYDDDEKCLRGRRQKRERVPFNYPNEKESDMVEDELYWRYNHMKKQQSQYPFNGYPYRHRKSKVDHSPFPHVNSYYKKHPFTIPTTDYAPWVGRDFFPDTGYGMSRVMDAYKGRYSDPDQVLRDLAIKNRQLKQWRESVQHYRDQVGYGDDCYDYQEQPEYYSSDTEFDSGAEQFEPYQQLSEEEQTQDYLNDKRFKFRQGKKPLERKKKADVLGREERVYQNEDCFVVYDECNYQGRRLDLCGEYPDIPSNLVGFKIFSFIVPENLEIRFFQSSEYENNVKDVEGSEECLQTPYELIPQ